MAQYSNLKAYIEEKIYENGTQAITGDILQDVLKVMTDDLGEFYQMGGMASPSTDPGTPDAKVIYFATEAGTYTNFGGITLAAGEVALLIFETSWTKETLNVLSAANGGVKTANLADGAVTTEKIAGGAVETAKIANNAVTSGKVADGAIGTAKIADGAIDADKIAANAVESAKIKNGAVTEGKINDGAVTADKVAVNAVTTAKIADDAVTTAKLNDGAVTEDKVATDAVTSGKVKDGAIGTAKIAAGAVTHAKIGAGAVEESNIKDGAVTSDKIANGAVGSDQLAEGAFSAENLADGSVTTDKLADEAVTAEKIADGAVTADKFANGSVTTIKLGSGAVTTEKIGDGMVTRQKLADSSVGTSKIIDGAVTTDKVADGAITDAKLANPVSVSQNTSTGHIDISVGGKTTQAASVTDVNELSKTILGEADIIIDFGYYSKITGLIANGVWNTTFGQHYIIPVKPKQSIKILPQTTARAAYCFLKTNDAPVNGATPNYATGYSEAINIDSLTYIDAPIDANYLYILATADVDNDRTPLLLELIGSKGDIPQIQDDIEVLNERTDLNIYSQPASFVLKHINSEGYLNDNGNRNVTFNKPVIALSGSTFGVDAGFQFQYALYNINTGAFIERVTWQNWTHTVTLNADYRINIEISMIPETPMADTSISEHLHFLLFASKDTIKGEISQLNNDVDDINGKINNLTSVAFDFSGYATRGGILANGIWANVTDTNYKHYVLPIAPNTIVRISPPSSTVRTAYCFFKTDDIAITGQAPNFATGYTGAINVAETVEVQVPADGRYMYILAQVDDSIRTPSYCGTIGLINGMIKDAEEEMFSIVREDDASAFMQLSQQADNLIGVIGLNSFKQKTMQIVAPDKYSCWPFVGKVGDKLVVVYVKALEHEDQNKGAIWISNSANGIVWTPKRLLIDTLGKRDGITGKGNDADGNMIIWNRVGYPGNSATYYELWKSTDGFNFTKISTLNSGSNVGHAGDIINVPTIGLMSFYNSYGSTRSWGKLVSSDGGETWTNTIIESGLGTDECPVEISAAYLGDNKILAIGRFDNYSSSTPRLWQLQSDDNGVTWTRVATNIVSAGNTASVIFDAVGGYLTMYLYNRSTGQLEYRRVLATEIWNNPTGWPNATIIGGGATGQDAGNVNAIQFGDIQVAAFYSGSATDTGIYVTIM